VVHGSRFKVHGFTVLGRAPWTREPLDREPRTANREP